MALSIRRVRQFYAWHKWTGLIGAVFILVINFTGAVAVFKEEIDRLVTPAKVVRPGPSKMPLDEVVAGIKRERPEARLGAISMPERPDAAYVITAQENRKRLDIFADPYTGRITGTRTGETLANVIRQAHLRFYYFGYWGRVVVGIFGVVLLISTITGLLIYGRFMRGVFSRGLRFWNIRPTFQLATSDWHKLIGITALAFNLLIAFTGAILGLENLLSYAPGSIDKLQHRPSVVANRATRKVTRQRQKKRTTEVAPAPVPAVLSLEDQLRVSREAIPGFEPQTVPITDRAGRAIIYGKAGGVLARERTSYVVLDTASGEVIEKFRQSQGSTTNKLYFLVEPLHYGAFGDVVVKTIYLLFGFTGAFLSITGFILWWMKRRRKKGHPKPCAEPSLQSSASLQA